MRQFLRHIWNTKGLARWILLAGTVITVVFIVFAIFAPWIAPYDFNQTRVDGVKLPKLARTTSSTTSTPGSSGALGPHSRSSSCRCWCRSSSASRSA